MNGFEELRARIDTGITCLCEVADVTCIERGRLGSLLYGEAVPEAHEVLLAMHMLIELTDRSDEDPLLRKLRLVVEADVARPPREAVLAAARRLFADAKQELERKRGVQ